MLLATIGYRAADAEPYIPSSDAVVLATVATSERDEQGRIDALRAALRREPRDATAAAELARLYAQINAGSGDPRYLGYALGVIEPWREIDAPPEPIWLVRARIAQRLHRFADAQADLERLLHAHSSNREAALLLSTVGIVRGDYAATQRACAYLSAQRQAVLAAICTANRSPYGGDVATASRALDALLATGVLEGEIETWVLTLAAELAVGSGDLTNAERHYREAMATVQGHATPDLYLLGSYADFLTDEGRGEDALKVLGDAPATDGVVIRRALAAADGPTRRRAAELVGARMTALARREVDDAHARELAWAHLHVLHDAQVGLRYAQRNWQHQREMRDARLLLEASLAARDFEAARPVVEWMAANGIRHSWLDGLVDRWERADAP